MSEIKLAAQRENILGEGVCWEPRRERVYWVDIKGRRLEWLHPASGEAGAWTLELQPSAVAPFADGRLLLATDAGLVVFNPADGRAEHRLELEPDRPENRTNDGGVDNQGRFWIGTMNDKGVSKTGAVYRVNTDWTVARMIDNLGIPNTTAFSPDGRTFYLADSRAGMIWGYDLDPLTGALGYRHVLAKTEVGVAPDGSAVDIEGCVWNAEWGGSRIVRYTPDGRIDRVVELPVSQPTKCAFGGPGLRTLFITSAREGLSDEALAAQPLAGSLFYTDPGVAGLPHTPFGGQ